MNVIIERQKKLFTTKLEETKELQTNGMNRNFLRTITNNSDAKEWEIQLEISLMENEVKNAGRLEELIHEIQTAEKEKEKEKEQRRQDEENQQQFEQEEIRKWR